MSKQPITLYRLQACPFCERVVRTLDELGVEYRSRYVEPMHSARDVVKRVLGARSVPAIVDPDTGVTMSESANIVEYLERRYDSAGTENDRTIDDATTDGGRADGDATTDGGRTDGDATEEES